MSIDEDFTRALRERIDVVAPRIEVDTSHVVSGARRRRAIRVGATACALTAVLAAGAAVSVAGFHVRPTTIPPAVPEPSQTEPAASDPAQSAPEGGWPDANFWYVSYEYELEGVTHHGESWRPHHGDGASGYADDTDLAAPHAGDGANVIDGDRSKATLLGRNAFFLTGNPDDCADPPLEVDWDVLYALPTDGVALEELLSACVTDDPVGVRDQVVAARMASLAQTPASPALRRAAWAVVARLDGVVVTPGVTDSRGRPGTRYEWGTPLPDPAWYIVDPASGMPLELSDPATQTHVVYLEQGPADALPGGLTFVDPATTVVR